MSTLMEVRHLKKYFDTPRGKLHAVDDVSFTIEEGHTLGVVGESGCGKSTLGRVMIRLLEATDGEVLFEGQNILREKNVTALRRKLQIIFQDPFSSLNPRMTVGETIAEPLEIHRLCKSEQEKTERVDALMETVGLAERFVNSYPHELDGGRRQRIGIARALALDPRFIVCDEPVSSLDVSIQAQILNLMQDLQEARGFTYLFITHDLSVVRFISQEIMVMYLGMAVEKAETETLFSHPLHPYTRALLAAIPEPIYRPVRKRRQLLTGEITSPIEPKPCCRFAQRCPMAKQECFERVPELAEAEPGHFVACHRWQEA